MIKFLENGEAANPKQISSSKNYEAGVILALAVIDRWNNRYFRGFDAVYRSF